LGKTADIPLERVLLEFLEERRFREFLEEILERAEECNSTECLLLLALRHEVAGLWKFSFGKFRGIREE
jgi:hypothetical protein